MANVYEIVTGKIIEALQQGVIPWHKPWSADGTAPANFQSKRQYNGINALLLGLSDYAAPYWLTFKQAQKLGGSVRKGERSTLVTFWKQLKDKDNPDKKGAFMMRYYRVFNIEQCDGIEYTPAQVKPVEFNHDDDPMVASYKNRPEITIGGGRACYNPRTDLVKMPEPGRFDTLKHYRATLYHELVHSTGHSSRLDRGLDKPATFGSPSYAREELIAEIGACFLNNRAGIDSSEVFDNSAAYISNWMRRLKDDPKLVITAASKAQKAADLIAGVDNSITIGPAKTEQAKPAPKRTEQLELIAA